MNLMLQTVEAESVRDGESFINKKKRKTNKKNLSYICGTF